MFEAAVLITMLSGNTIVSEDRYGPYNTIEECQARVTSFKEVIRQYDLPVKEVVGKCTRTSGFKI